MWKACSKFVPKVLTAEQKAACVKMCQQLMEKSEHDITLFGQIITGDESWISEHDPSNKHQTMQWKHSDSPKHKKAHAFKSKEKAVMVVFFNSQGVVMVNRVPVGKNVNAEYYLKIQRTLQKCTCRKCPELRDRRIGCCIRTMCLVITQLRFSRFSKKITSKSVMHSTHPTWLPQTHSYSPAWNWSSKGSTGSLWKSLKINRRQSWTPFQQKSGNKCFNDRQILLKKCTASVAGRFQGEQDWWKLISNILCCFGTWLRTYLTDCVLTTSIPKLFSNRS